MDSVTEMLMMEWRNKEAFRCQMEPGDLERMAEVAVEWFRRGRASAVASRQGS